MQTASAAAISCAPRRSVVVGGRAPAVTAR